MGDLFIFLFRTEMSKVVKRIPCRNVNTADLQT